MSIPFFSIDFKKVDWLAYLKGTIGINFEKSIDKLISKRFPSKKFLKFSSSRMGFYFYLEQNFKPGDEIIFSWDQIKNDRAIALDGVYKISVKGMDVDGNNVEKSTTVTIWK